MGISGWVMILPAILWKVFRNSRIETVIITKLQEKKGTGSTPLSLAFRATVQECTVCPQQSPTALVFDISRRKTFCQAHPFLGIAYSLTTCGQGKPPTFISYLKLVTNMPYQLTASSFKLSFQDHCPTLEPFQLLAAAESQFSNA